MINTLTSSIFIRMNETATDTGANETLRRKQFMAAVAAAGVVFLIGWLDYRSGWEFGFFVFYFVPISFAGWYGNRTVAVTVAAMSAIAWLVADLHLANHYSTSFFAFWNGFIRLIAFVLIAVLVSRVKQALEHQKKVSADLQASLDQVKQLKGMLPICASCKKIRNNKGYWEQIEHYITERSETEFTHGLCPDCAMRLYPELMERMREEKKDAT